MRSTFRLPSLPEYDISAEQGFLSSDRPETMPDCAPLHELGHELPKLLSARRVRSFLDRQRSLLSSIPPTWQEQDCRAAMRILSFVGHAYVWESPEHPAGALPAQLAQPWYEVAQRLGRPPVLSYASYALDNWRRLDASKPIALDNIVLLQNFLGGLDEEWFVVVHVQIERQAGPGLAGLVRAMHGAALDRDSEALMGLQALASAQTEMRDSLLRMKERCDPYVYYTRVRPYIHGWKNSPSLPDGLLYEGVSAYGGRPQSFRGETGAQSSIIPALDAFLGIVHRSDPLRAYLLEMRDYMPPAHRAFVAALEAGSPVRDLVARQRAERPELRRVYNRCIRQLHSFRTLHIGFAARYVQEQSQKSAANPTAVGTGGTPFMSYLEKHRRETEEHLL